ncbi:hypothetical protein ACH4E8_34465 [Streptomyces sp. NPDC017979]|uniref:hypothetical protein n=1 Tax=Streptomyces sp. NPDC017979 TaxID=3365024 RepID=UPI00378E7DCC
MSRSRQAALLARHLSETAGARVELAFDSGAWWMVSWADGPTVEGMHELVDAALAGPRYAEMRDRKIDYVRSPSDRAWAARAIASRRDGTLARAVADGAAKSSDTHELYALLRHIATLVQTTAYPERADVPEDEPDIQELLAAGTRLHPRTGRSTRSEHDMARALFVAERAPAGYSPPRLTVVPVPEKR